MIGLFFTEFVSRLNCPSHHRGLSSTPISHLVLPIIGILSLFCCGIAVSQWVLPAMSAAGSSSTTTAIKTLRCVHGGFRFIKRFIRKDFSQPAALLLVSHRSHLAEGIIFIYVGLDALDPVKWKVGHLSLGTLLGRPPCSKPTLLL